MSRESQTRFAGDRLRQGDREEKPGQRGPKSVGDEYRNYGQQRSAEAHARNEARRDPGPGGASEGVRPDGTGFGQGAARR
jgi:hypothetical protein